MRRALFGLALWVLSFASCAPPTPKDSSESSAPSSSAPSNEAAASGPSKASSTTPAQNDAPAVEPANGAQTTRPEARSPGINLPSDAAFLAAPLPAAVASYPNWRELERIDVGQSHLMEVDRLASGRLVTVSQSEGKVRVYEPSTKRLTLRHDIAGFQEFEPNALLAWPVAPDRFVLGTPSGLYVHDAESGQLLARADEHAVWKLRWSADSRILMALGSGGAQGPSVLRFFARGTDSSLQRLGELAFAERVDAWDLSRDNRLLAVTHYPSGLLRVLELEHTGEREVYRGYAPRFAGDVAFSPDGRYLAVGGDGLLVVDLINPARIAFYSYVKNNIGHVRFSPSGDAVVASAYDGKVRIFRLDSAPSGTLSLELVKELLHANQANVYAFAFTADGSQLVSTSGDRTLRTFGQRPTRPGASDPAGAAAPRTFHDLAAWRKLDPSALAPLPSPAGAGGAATLASASGPARPSRIVAGVYACKITLLYKMRTCWVRRDEDGRTRLEFAEDNLLHLGGILWDDGSIVRFEGQLLTPSTLIECPGCERQALHGVFRGKGGKYQGLLMFRTYYDPHVPPPMPTAEVAIEEANDRYPLVLEYRGPLEESRPGQE